MKNMLVVLMTICFITSYTNAFYEEEKEEFSMEIMSESSATGELTLNATNAILYDMTYETILYEKKAYEKVPNASTTKMLTAIVAYENATVNDIVTVGKNAVNTGGSVIGLRSGDRVSLDDLLKGMLIHSGNDAAVAIAEYIGGDVDNFCAILNQKANEIGLQSTNFVTPHGLDAENHYSSAYDLAKMAEYLLKIDYLANIVKLKTANIQINNQTRIITTTNEMLSLYEGTNGVKTGFTGNAGRCLVTSCTQNNRTLISVVLGCGTKGQRTSDSQKLLNYGFQEFDIIDICENMRKEFIIHVNKGKNPYYQIRIEKSIFMPIKRKNKNELSYQYQINTELQAPVISNTPIGSITVLLENTTLCIIHVNVPELIPQKSFLDYISGFLFENSRYFEINP